MRALSLSCVRNRRIRTCVFGAMRAKERKRARRIDIPVLVLERSIRMYDIRLVSRKLAARVFVCARWWWWWWTRTQHPHFLPTTCFLCCCYRSYLSRSLSLLLCTVESGGKNFRSREMVPRDALAFSLSLSLSCARSILPRGVLLQLYRACFLYMREVGIFCYSPPGCCCCCCCFRFTSLCAARTRCIPMYGSTRSVER